MLHQKKNSLVLISSTGWWLSYCPGWPSCLILQTCGLLWYWQLHATYCFCSVTIFKCAQFKILLPIDICIHAHAYSLVNPILWNSRLRKYIELALKRSVDTASAFDCDCKPPDASPLMLAPAPDGCLLITDFACSTNLPDAACCYWRAGANLTPEWCLACSRLQKRCLARAMGMTMKLVGTHSEGPIRFKKNFLNPPTSKSWACGRLLLSSPCLLGMIVALLILIHFWFCPRLSCCPPLGAGWLVEPWARLVFVWTQPHWSASVLFVKPRLHRGFFAFVAFVCTRLVFAWTHHWSVLVLLVALRPPWGLFTIICFICFGFNTQSYRIGQFQYPSSTVTDDSLFVCCCIYVQLVGFCSATLLQATPEEHLNTPPLVLFAGHGQIHPQLSTPSLSGLAHLKSSRL